MADEKKTGKAKGGLLLINVPIATKEQLLENVPDHYRLREFKAFYYSYLGQEEGNQIHFAKEFFGLGAPVINNYMTGNKNFPQKHKQRISDWLSSLPMSNPVELTWENFRYNIAPPTVDEMTKQAVNRNIRIYDAIIALQKTSGFTLHKIFTDCGKEKEYGHLTNQMRQQKEMIHHRLTFNPAPITLFLYHIEFEQTGKAGKWRVSPYFIEGLSEEIFERVETATSKKKKEEALRALENAIGLLSAEE